MPPAPELAKLSRPRIFRVSPRERLFRLLDERREHPVVWLAGAPGSGKTVLVASYLEARKLQAIWYHADPGDADPATFFYYLGLAGGRLGGKKAPPLPLYTDEYRRDLNGFARRWFREFFARMPAGGVLVLDNLHEAGHSAEARAAFATGLEEIPVGVNVVVISRPEPPSEFARLVANQTIARVGAAELRFTRDEAGRLLAGDGELPAEALEAVYRRSDGWAAGLILLREHATRGPARPDEGGPATPEAVFAYFAGEIVNRIPADNQRVLVLCALPPRITRPIAVALTGEADAGKLLEYGYRRHLFVSRRDGDEPVYEFHALFREFLLKRAPALLGAEALAAHRRRAAELLEAAGAGEGAFELYRDAGDWTNAVRVALADAPDMLAHGRFQSVLERIAALPPAAREAEPWLAYWAGLARANVDPVAARSDLERAYDGFVLRGDTAAQIQAVEAVIVSHYLAWDDWRPVDRWTEVMEKLLARSPAFASPAAEARALSSLAIGLVYRQPGHRLLLELLDRLAALLDEVGDRNLEVAIATRLIDGLNKTGSFARSQAIAARVRAAMDDPTVRPLTGAWARIWLANLYYFQARLDDFERVLDEARAIAEANGLPFFVSVIELFRGWGRLARGDLREAAPVLARLAATIDPGRKLDLALLRYLEGWSAASRGDFPAAEREARVAAQVSLETGSVASALICHTGLALALLETGQPTAALGVLERMRSLVDGVRGGVLRYAVSLWEAYLRLRTGEGDWRSPLAEALALGRREGYFNHYLWWPPMMSRLAAAAIAEGIETDYVRRLVAARGLPPDPDVAAGDWPWPLRIHALGKFEVLQDGTPLAFRGKAQKKPLELLKALVALGGEGVDTGRLAAILWPDAAGDAAKVSFDSTLYRLRKLLGQDAALALVEGKLSLDRRQCFVDVWAFERIAREADGALDAAGSSGGATAADSAAGAAAAALARRLLDAYPGHFLAADEDQPWLMALRDRLRSKLVRAVLALGHALEADARWQDAIALYSRALELDNLAEDLYRSLMVCYRELGRPAEGLRVYRRCRELLSVVLALPPSPETEAVRQSLETAV
jgi:ATP/maltotriose-dependent transcriptional regulator MalT/DNA-binding SARP family transcriptional activator